MSSVKTLSINTQYLDGNVVSSDEVVEIQLAC